MQLKQRFHTLGLELKLPFIHDFGLFRVRFRQISLYVYLGNIRCGHVKISCRSTQYVLMMKITCWYQRNIWKH